MGNGYETFSPFNVLGVGRHLKRDLNLFENDNLAINEVKRTRYNKGKLVTL